MFGPAKRQITVDQKQFDDAARALYLHINGEQPPEPFAVLENDNWWVLARVALEGAGIRV